LVGYVFGAVYVVVGLLGFTVSGGHDFAGHDGGKLLGIFMVNPLHNVAHILIGAVLVGAASAGIRAAKSANAVIGAAYLLLGVLGLFITGDHGANILALNSADNVLHFASAVLLLAVGLTQDRLAGDRTAARATV
jgi:hypothetical protein